jgi:hypothetical protein
MHFQEGDKGPFLMSHRNGRIKNMTKQVKKKKCELRIKELTQSFPSKGILHLGGKNAVTGSRGKKNTYHIGI